MRIAILGPYFWPQTYGIEKVMYAHAKHLAARGHEVEVITTRLTYPMGSKDDLPTHEMIDGLSIRRINVILRVPPFFYYPSGGGFLLPGLSATLRRFAPQIIHSHNIGAAAWAYGGASYARSSGSRFFYSTYYHVTNLKLNTFRKSVLRILNSIPLKLASMIYHQTNFDFQPFLTEYPFAPVERFKVLRNGVETARAVRLHPATNTVNILFVGRVDDARKGFKVLTSAIDTLPAEIRMKLKLTVVGSISQVTRVQLASTYGAAIRVLGPISEDELEQEYAEADIFAMPSLYEGFGMPYIEAMRYGIPVVGTNVGGVPEVVPPDTGFLTLPGSIPEVSHAIARLASDRSLRRAMGAAGKKWADNFHWDRVIDELEADYATSLVGSTRNLMS